jgi:hypothetical protein
MSCSALPRDLEVHEAHELEPCVDARDVLLHPRLVDHAAPVGELRRARPGEEVVERALDHAGAAERDALVVELVGDELPAAVDLPDDVRLRHADVVVERLVGVHVAHVLDGRHAEARRVRRHDDHRDALVLGRLGIGAAREPDVVGVGGEAREDLLPVDDPLVAVEDGARLERRQVGARVGLGVADREVDLAAQDSRQEELLLLVRPVLHDRRRDGVDGEHGHRRAGPHRLVEEDVLLDRRHAAAAVLLRPADAEPLVAAHLEHDLADPGADALGAPDLGAELGGEQLRIVLAQLLAEGLVFGAVRETHGWFG